MMVTCRENVVFFISVNATFIFTSSRSSGEALLVKMYSTQSQYQGLIKKGLINIKRRVHSLLSWPAVYKEFYPTLYDGCNCLSMLGLQLKYIFKRGGFHIGVNRIFSPKPSHESMLDSCELAHKNKLRSSLFFVHLNYHLKYIDCFVSALICW